MAFNSIDANDLEIGKPTKKSIFTTIKDNFDDHESRIAALSAAANKIVAFDEFIDFSSFGIGRTVSAAMTESEFQAINGTDWVLCDGSSVAGTLYATVSGNSTVPDLRGEFVRGLDNGRGVDSGRSLGSAQGDQMQSHNHGGGDHSHGIPTGGFGTGSTFIDRGANTGPNIVNTNSSGTIISTEGGTDNGSENRPRNVALNYFMKVDHTIKLNLKAREDQTIVAVKAYVIDQNGLPTSGTLSFDIKKGSTRALLSSIFSVQPTLAFGGGVSDGDGTDSGTFLSGGASLSQGDWVELEVTSIMTGQTGIYIQVFSEPA